MMHAPLVRTSFGKVITASSMTRSVSQNYGYALLVAIVRYQISLILQKKYQIKCYKQSGTIFI